MLFNGVIMYFLENLNKESIPSDFEFILKQLEKTFNIYITVHDYSGVLLHLNGKRLLFERNLHHCPFCIKGRFTIPKWRALCIKDCLRDSDANVLRESKPYIKSCWKGVMELVIPIIRHKKPVAAIYVGGFKGNIPAETSLSSEYLKIHKSLPDIPDNETIHEIISTITVVFHGMISAKEYVLEEYEDIELGRKHKISRYIQERAHTKIKLNDLAEYLYLSPSRTGHLVQTLFNKSFTELLIQERMLRAKSLLLNDWLSIEEIAHTVGFNNEFYFNSVFKKFFGLPPGRFRKKNI
jgi:AraC-like DNA-binding protein/ligand-binding sensor protein